MLILSFLAGWLVGALHNFVELLFFTKGCKNEQDLQDFQDGRNRIHDFCEISHVPTQNN
jgi:hypothetical protein